MNEHDVLLVVCGIFLVGCFQPANDPPAKRPPQADAPQAATAPVVPAAPPSVTRGQPVMYDAARYDPKEWMKKTRADKVDVWFRVEDDQWWIDWDAERQPFEYIIIHHSATPANATAESIDSGQKQRLYAGRYQNSNDDPFVQGLPIHSGHIVNGRERFIAYHHLVLADGRVTTELQPLFKINDTWFVDMVGWNAGDWEVNCRSIGICLVDDFNNQEPPPPQLEAAAALIAYYRQLVPTAKVKPHHDFKATECPGKTWPQWKDKLLR